MKQKKKLTFGRIIGIICLCATVACAGLYFVLGRDEPAKAVDFYPAINQQDVYVYLDITQIDDVIAKDSKRQYFLAYDGTYGYAVGMSEKLFNEILKENSAHYDENGYTYILAKPCRIYGIAREVSEKLQDIYCETYQLSKDDYVSYYGTLYLDGTSTPGSERRELFLYAGIASLIIAIAGLSSVPDKRRTTE